MTVDSFEDLLKKKLFFMYYLHIQICRVEDILVEGLIEGSVVHFHRATTIAVQSSGIITASGKGMLSFPLTLSSHPIMSS